MGTGRPEPFGGVLSVNFGPASEVTSRGPATLGFSGNITDGIEFPPLALVGPHGIANMPTSHHREISSRPGPSHPPILELHASTELPLASDAEVAESASLREADLASALANASVARGMVHSRQVSQIVVLLKVSRDPRPYHEMLNNCSELAQVRDNLAAAGKHFKLPSGATIFMNPELYDAASNEMTMRAITLFSQHVLVSQELETIVSQVIQRIPCNSKVRLRQRRLFPSGLASEAASSNMNITIQRTFINVDVPGPLLSSPSGSAYIASTSEAHNAPNPRRTRPFHRARQPVSEGESSVRRVLSQPMYSYSASAILRGT